QSRALQIPNGRRFAFGYEIGYASDSGRPPTNPYKISCLSVEKRSQSGALSARKLCRSMMIHRPGTSGQTTRKPHTASPPAVGLVDDVTPSGDGSSSDSGTPIDLGSALSRIGPQALMFAM